jgi:hypothetical protein
VAAIFQGKSFIPIAATKRVGLIQVLDLPDTLTALGETNHMRLYGLARVFFSISLLTVLASCTDSDSDSDSSTESSAQVAKHAEEQATAAADEAALMPSAEAQVKVKRFIISQGLWCGNVVRFREDSFKSSVNHKVYYVFCDDGSNAQGYEIRMSPAGELLSLTEV